MQLNENEIIIDVCIYRTMNSKNSISINKTTLLQEFALSD